MEVVFSDSAKAGLTWAARRKMHSTMKIGSVAGLSFLLDVGDISGEVIGEARTQAIWNLYGSAFDSREDAPFRNFIRGIAYDLKRVCDAAKRGEAIRIWHSDAPQDACGLRHLLWEIRDCECPVCEVVLPRRAVRADGAVVQQASWACVEPEEFCRYLTQAREIPSPMRNALAQEWRAMVSENAPLRACVNGVLVGVEEDFYDVFLRRCLPEGEFQMAQWIGATLGRYELGVGDGWYAGRIRRMIDCGEIEAVRPGEADYPYSAWLRKTI